MLCNIDCKVFPYYDPISAYDLGSYSDSMVDGIVNEPSIQPE